MKEVLPYATAWMNLEDIKCSKPGTERQIVHDSTYMRHKKWSNS
jgi:hypothetical protein